MAAPPRLGWPRLDYFCLVAFHEGPSVVLDIFMFIFIFGTMPLLIIQLDVGFAVFLLLPSTWSTLPSFLAIAGTASLFLFPGCLIELLLILFYFDGRSLLRLA